LQNFSVVADLGHTLAQKKNSLIHSTHGKVATSSLKSKNCIGLPFVKTRWRQQSREYCREHSKSIDVLTRQRHWGSRHLERVNTSTTLKGLRNFEAVDFADAFVAIRSPINGSQWTF
jgi:hypothetical protein